jgi:hypothetical protein
MKMTYSAALIGGWLLISPAGAALVDGASAPLAISPYSFQTTEDGTANPTYTYTGVPGYGTLSISYGSFFDGQMGSDPFSPPASVTGVPNSPLAPSAYTDPSTGAPDWQTIIEVDNNASAPNTEVLGGLPVPATNGFGGPVAILFSEPVTGGGGQLTVGYLDTAGLTTIEAFNADGTSLGTVTNTGTGYETFNLSDDTGLPFEGLLITSSDPGGFGIDGVGVTAMPAPGALAVLPGFAVALLTRRGMRRQRRGGAPRNHQIRHARP